MAEPLRWFSARFILLSWFYRFIGSKSGEQTISGHFLQDVPASVWYGLDIM